MTADQLKTFGVVEVTNRFVAETRQLARANQPVDYATKIALLCPEYLRGQAPCVIK